MNRTTNYKLCQWERSDKVLMEDFNEDNAKLDGAIKAEADARTAAVTAERTAREAAVRMLNTAIAGGVKLKAGVYAGTGTDEWTIHAGFPPKALIIQDTDVIAFMAYGATRGHAIKDGTPYSYDLTWTETGVDLSSVGNSYNHLNSKFGTYQYVILG